MTHKCSGLIEVGTRVQQDRHARTMAYDALKGRSGSMRVFRGSWRLDEVEGAGQGHAYIGI